LQELDKELAGLKNDLEEARKDLAEEKVSDIIDLFSIAGHCRNNP
jgi:hypothetical protein